MSVKYRVIVDERERPSKVPYFLTKLNLMVEFRLLEVGDYILPGFAIERKSISDFVKSLYSGRIFDQAYQLSDVYEHAILIVEGDFRAMLDRGLRARAYWGALTTLNLDYGLTLYFTPDSEQTANLIYTLARWKPKRLETPLIRKKIKSENLRRMQILQLSCLPGIGPKLAERMLERFGTVRKALTASIAELSMVCLLYTSPSPRDRG